MFQLFCPRHPQTHPPKEYDSDLIDFDEPDRIEQLKEENQKLQDKLRVESILLQRKDDIIEYLTTEVKRLQLYLKLK